MLKSISPAALCCGLTISPASSPADAAFRMDQVSVRSGVVVVANKQDNTASILNAADGKLLATLPVGVTVSADGRHAYVALQGTNQVAVVDLRSAAVVAHLASGAGPDGIAHAFP